MTENEVGSVSTTVYTSSDHMDRHDKKTKELRFNIYVNSSFYLRLHPPSIALSLSRVTLLLTNCCRAWKLFAGLIGITLL